MPEPNGQKAFAAAIVVRAKTKRASRQRVDAEPREDAKERELGNQDRRNSGGTDQELRGRYARRGAPIGEREREGSRQRADREHEARARARHRLGGKEDDETGERADDRDDIGGVFLFEHAPLAHLEDGADRPRRGQQHERIEQRGEMVAIGEEPDSLRRVRDHEEAQGAQGTLRDLCQPDEGAEQSRADRAQA